VLDNGKKYHSHTLRRNRIRWYNEYGK